jgi:hypothetical protein
VAFKQKRLKARDILGWEKPHLGEGQNARETGLAIGVTQGAVGQKPRLEPHPTGYLKVDAYGQLPD